MRHLPEIADFHFLENVEITEVFHSRHFRGERNASLMTSHAQKYLLFYILLEALESRSPSNLAWCQGGPSVDNNNE